MARQLDQELQRRVTALEVLAQSKTLQLDDLAAFRARAAVLADSLFPGENVVLLDANGQLLASTQSAPGQPLPVRPDMSSTHEVFATGRAGVTNLFHGLVSGRDVVAVDVPVKGFEGTVAVLSISPGLEVFADMLQRQKLPPGWVAAIFDRKGITVARTLSPERFVGGLAAEGFLGPLLERSEGIVENRSREDIPLLSVFSHGERFGWSVGIGVPTAQLTAPAVDTALRTLGISALLLLLCIGFASLLARQILKRSPCCAGSRFRARKRPMRR
ncbi:MAG: cache domain-containing protein [Pseudomonadota bacterium]